MGKNFTILTLVILLIGLGIATLVIFIDWQPAPEPLLCNGQPCNVILIIPETLSARHMGIYGYERDTTPFIDEFFSEESLVFENAWSTAPWTMPSFAALFTSQLPSEVFVEGWGDKLSSSIPSFIDVLEKKEIPKFAAHSLTLFPVPNMDLNIITRFKQGERFQQADPFLFLKTVDWIEGQAQKDEQKPFFILLQPLASHEPYDPPKPYRYFFDAPSEYPGPVTVKEIAKAALERGEDAGMEVNRLRLQYDQDIRCLDGQIESFVSQIPEEIVQNTIFIFTSDHGEAFGQHNNFSHGVTLYEEEIHIPFLIRAPGIDSKRIQEPITLLDAGPTILEIFGLKNPKTFQGLSLVPAMRGEKLPLEERIMKAEMANPKYTVIPEGWEKIKPEVRTEPLPRPHQIAVRKGEWKLYQRPDDSLELYNLERDYKELDNLIPQWDNLSKEERTKILPLFEELIK